MTGARVTVHSTGAERHLRAYGRQMRDFRRFWRKVGGDLGKLQRTWWATKGRGSWPPRRRPGGHPLMVETGALQRKMTSHTQFLQQHGPREVQVVIPRAVFYGQFHQEGTTNMPRRPVIAPLSMMRPIVRRAARRHADYSRVKRIG